VSHLRDSTWTEVARRSPSGPILLIPLGSTEQHGPHLPVTTDTDIAEAIAGSAAGQDGRLVVAPPVAYGSSGEHEGFAGTLSIGQEATELVVTELGRSASADFAHVVVVSAHGGNAEPVARAMRRLADEDRRVEAWSPPWSGDLHAGRTETSLMLAIAPDRVRLEQAEPGDPRPIGVLLPVLRDRGVQAVSANGVLGDPTGANPAEGQRLLAVAVADLLQRLGHPSRPTVVEVGP
jgi:creatinine amidohydrolase